MINYWEYYIKTPMQIKIDIDIFEYLNAFFVLLIISINYLILIQNSLILIKIYINCINILSMKNKL